MYSRKPRSLGEIRRQRQLETLVGRDGELEIFQQSITSNPEDDNHKFVFSIFGQAGVGKTSLLRRFQSLAASDGALTAQTDEAQEDIPTVMGRIAEQLDEIDHPLKSFSERYTVYRQRRQELEADPDVPHGMASLIGRTIGKSGVVLARRIPIVGMAADFIDADAMASEVGELAQFVAKKIRNKDEVRLLTDPISTLTPLFLNDLHRITEDHDIVLFFDTYERTGTFLDEWLRGLLEERYGDIPANLAVVIAGQNELDRNRWAAFDNEGLLARLGLEPFSEDEARDYLTRKAITDERVVETILRLSGRLPLLVATLASESPRNPLHVDDPSGTAVERFLKWVEDPSRQRIALLCALPRRLNQDILSALVGEEMAGMQFSWLRSIPFVLERSDGWSYHDLVREQMLRQQYRESPRNWAENHSKLADYYAGLLHASAAPVASMDTLSTRIEVLYHRLCADPKGEQTHAISLYFEGIKEWPTAANKVATAIRKVGTDTGSRSIEELGKLLRAGARSLDLIFVKDFGSNELSREMKEEHASAAIGALSTVIDNLDPGTPLYYEALSIRGIVFCGTHRPAEGIADFSKALALGQDEEAIRLDRGIAYLLAGNRERAAEDFSRLVQRQPESPLVSLLLRMAEQGIFAYTSGSERLADAIPDFTPNNDAFRLVLRLYLIKAFILKLAELTEKLTVRYCTELMQASQHSQLFELLTDIELYNPEYYQLYEFRGRAATNLGKFQAALRDFDRAIAIEPTRRSALRYERGLVHSYLGHYTEAIESYTDERDDLGDDFTALYDIAVVQARWKGVTAAENEITRARTALQAIEHPDSRWQALYGLAGLEALAGDPDDALRYLNEAVSLEISAVEWARHDVAWLDFRHDPRYLAIVSRSQTERASDQRDSTTAK